MTAPTTRSSGTNPTPARSGRRLRGRRSGQAMTEAVITLCLLSFAWLVTAYLLALAENRVRCAAVGRHVAWHQAHNPGTTLSAAQLTPFFIRHQATVAPSGTPSVRNVDADQALNTPEAVAVLDELNLGTLSIQHVEERLNIGNPDDRPIYLVDQREVPLMLETFSAIPSVGVATCEWLTVEEVLEDRVAVQNAILN